MFSILNTKQTNDGIFSNKAGENFNLSMYVHHWRHPGVFIVNFEHLSCLVFLLFILSRYVPAGFKTAGIYLFKVNNGTMRRMHGICFSRKETFYVKIFCSVVSLPTLTRFQFKLFLDTGYLSVFRPNGGNTGQENF